MAHEAGHTEAIQKLRDHTSDIATDVALIKAAILGNGTKGLSERVSELENASKGVIRAIATGLLSGGVTIAGAVILYKLWGIS